MNWRDRLDVTRKLSFLKCLVIININIVTAWFIYNWLMSVWLLSSPYGRSDFWWCECVYMCVSVFCLHVHVPYECVCVCGRVCVCTSTVDNFCVCTACLCPLWKTGKFLAPQSSWCVSFIVYLCVCVRACVVTLAQVVRLHDSRYSYGVLTCADAWPVWEREAAGVRAFTVKRSTSTVRVSDAPLASTGDVRTMHSMYLSSCGYLVFSGFGIWFLLSVHVCDLFFHAVYLLLYRKAHFLCFVFLIIFLCWSLAWKLNRLSSCQKFSKQQNVVVVVVEGLDFCFLLSFFSLSFFFFFPPENIKHTLLSVKVVGCMNGKQKLFSEVLTVLL